MLYLKIELYCIYLSNWQKIINKSIHSEVYHFSFKSAPSGFSNDTQNWSLGRINSIPMWWKCKTRGKPNLILPYCSESKHKLLVPLKWLC